MLEIWMPVVLGAVLALAGGMITEWRSHRRQGHAIARAFAGEISAILAIIESRDYAKGLDECLNFTLQTRSPQPFFLEVNFKYSLVYESNTQQIGLLPPELASGVCTFYTLMFSLLEDATNPKFKELDFETFAKNLQNDIGMLKKMVELGSSLVAKLQMA